MTIEEQLAAATAAIAAANATISERDAALAASDRRATEAEAAARAAGEELAAASALLDEAQATIAARDAQIAHLQADLDASRSRESLLAASGGVLGTPAGAVATIPSGDDAGAGSVTDRLAAIKDPAARTAFIREHRDALLAAARV